ncbi:MAG: hypothetical protein JJE22_14280 [Bacteroidia bacterium]|nr:hypothetical protein [Bacteroidia bacterium]
MEVHAHTHSPRKKWTHYFWEFFMLFLAVTLGFFVENQREHFVEHKRERDYMRSVIGDLRLDTVEFSIENKDRETAIVMYDSLIILLHKKERTAFELQRIYYLARLSLRISPFPMLNDKAYEQMKSSGNLRLIRHKEIADRITKYYFNSKEIALNASQSLLRLQSLIEAQGKILDGTVFQEMTDLKSFSIVAPSGSPGLISEDKQTINELIVRSHYMMSILIYSSHFMTRLSDEALQLIEVLKKEYHLE